MRVEPSDFFERRGLRAEDNGRAADSKQTSGRHFSGNLLKWSFPAILTRRRWVLIGLSSHRVQAREAYPPCIVNSLS